MMASCEARLLKQKVISGPFTAKEIAEGALRDHLTQEDYEAPLKVFTYNFNIFSRVTCDSLENRFKTPLSSLATSDSPVVVTHTFSFYFREEHVWPPRLMLLRHQRGNLLPSSLRKSRRRSEKHGKTVTPPNFLLTLSFTLNIRFYIFP